MYPGQINPLDGILLGPLLSLQSLSPEALLYVSNVMPSQPLKARGNDRDLPVRLSAGFERVVEKEAGTFKYFLKIVPTEYINLRGEIPEAANAYFQSPGQGASSSVRICALCLGAAPHPQHFVTVYCHPAIVRLCVMSDA